jgi:CRP/FNR family transcriptional regulator, cyclic AMP receptor protein
LLPAARALSFLGYYAEMGDSPNGIIIAFVRSVRSVIFVINSNINTEFEVICMSMPTPMPFPSKHFISDLSERNPAAALFECMEEQFGPTCLPLKVKRNTILFNQGAKLSCLYLIKSGEILLTRLSPDGQETLISIMGPGEFFGEGALLSGTAATYSAHATKQSVLLQLPERKFKLLLDDPVICRKLLKAIARRCDDAWTQMEVLGCTHVKDKVRSGLLWLSDRIGVETCEGMRIDLNQTQLARMVGCARETLSREVSELRKMKTVDVRHNNGRKSLYIRNLGGLTKTA